VDNPNKKECLPITKTSGQTYGEVSNFIRRKAQEQYLFRLTVFMNHLITREL